LNDGINARVQCVASVGECTAGTTGDAIAGSVATTLPGTVGDAARRFGATAARPYRCDLGKGGGTYLDPGRAIVIGEHAMGHGGRIARSISHEMGHHRFTERPDMSSRETYVARMLRGEAAATLSNAQVRKEMLAGGGADIGISGSGDRPRQ